MSTTPRKPQEFAHFPQALQAWAKFGPYAAIVRTVIDADTVDVLADLGFSTYTYQTLRLRGIDAPERNTPAGKTARAFLWDLLPVGTPCVVTTHRTVTFGRYVADLHILSPGTGLLLDVAQHLISVGHARSYLP